MTEADWKTWVNEHRGDGPRWVSAARWERELLHVAGRSRLSPEESSLADYLYGRLNIIDTKASSLLTFNGILLAAAALPKDWTPRGVGVLLLVVAFVAWFGSTSLCLYIVGLRWPRLNPERADSDFGKYRLELTHEAAQRTAAYRLAKRLIGLASLLSIGVWIWQGFLVKMTRAA